MMVRAFQNATMSLRYSPKPVVVAPFGMTFGGGCEMALHGDRVRAAAETYIGLVEVGVGLIPAGGGTKEMTRARARLDPDGRDGRRPVPFRQARVRDHRDWPRSRPRPKRREALGFLRDEDSISMNGDRLIADAKQEVLALAATGYAQPQPRTDILALGLPALSTLKLGIHQMKRGGFISDHDAVIGEKLARILTGGDLNHPTRVSRAVPARSRTRGVPLACAASARRRSASRHMLKTGKPLRN